MRHISMYVYVSIEKDRFKKYFLLISSDEKEGDAEY